MDITALHNKKTFMIFVTDKELAEIYGSLFSLEVQGLNSKLTDELTKAISDKTDINILLKLFNEEHGVY